MNEPATTWERHLCTECGGAAGLVPPPVGLTFSTVTVWHTKDCNSQPGGPRWEQAVAQLRLLTRRQPVA